MPALGNIGNALAGYLIRRQPGEGFLLKADLSAFRRDQAHNGFQGGGLTDPVAPDQSSQFLFPNLQVGIVQDMAFAVKTIHFFQVNILTLRPALATREA